MNYSKKRKKGSTDFDEFFCVSLIRSLDDSDPTGGFVFGQDNMCRVSY